MNTQFIPPNFANFANFMQQMTMMQQMQQQQFFNGFIYYCQRNNLNYKDENIYNQYCQMYQNNMNNNMNNMYNNNMNYNNNMYNVNNNMTNMNNNMSKSMNNMNNNMSNSMNNMNINMNNNMSNSANNVNNNINNNMNFNINNMNVNNIQNPNNIGGINNNNPNDNQNDIYVHSSSGSEEPKQILPRTEKTLYLKPNELKMNPNPNFNQFAGLDNGIINVNLRTTSGFSVIINAPKSMSFEDLFINFANKAGVPPSTIGKELIFLYNAQKMDTKSKLPLSSLFKTTNAKITIVDVQGIIGA